MVMHTGVFGARVAALRTSASDTLLAWRLSVLPHRSTDTAATESLASALIHYQWHDNTICLRGIIALYCFNAQELSLALLLSTVPDERAVADRTDASIV